MAGAGTGEAVATGIPRLLEAVGEGVAGALEAQPAMTTRSAIAATKRAT